jgi:hypothetical protein
MFHRDGVPELPVSPLITFIVKDVGDYEGSSLILTNTFTTPGTVAGYYVMYPDLTSAVLLEALFVGTVTNRVADGTARLALTGLVAGNVVQQTDDNTYWSLVNAGAPTLDASWTSDVPCAEFVDFAAEIVLQESPGFGEESSQTFTLRLYSDYKRGGETAPAGGSTFSLGIVGNRYDITTLTGGGAGTLDGIITASGPLGPGALIAIDAEPAGTPVLWRLRELVITTTSVDTACVITTATPHKLADGQTVTLAGVAGATPAVDGSHSITVLSPTTFSIPFATTVAGAGGHVIPAELAASGFVRPDDVDTIFNPVYWQAVL